MWAYLVRRILQAFVILFIITMLCFILTRLSSDPMSQYATKQGMTAADRLAIEKSLGLDQPVPVQYLRWLGLALQGNLGNSFFSRLPCCRYRTASASDSHLDGHGGGGYHHRLAVPGLGGCHQAVFLHGQPDHFFLFYRIFDADLL